MHGPTKSIMEIVMGISVFDICVNQNVPLRKDSGVRESGHGVVKIKKNHNHRCINCALHNCISRYLQKVLQKV